MTEGFHGIFCINRAQSVNTGNNFWNRVYRAGSVSKEFIEICISADCCNDLYSKFLGRLDNPKGIYTEIFKL